MKIQALKPTENLRWQTNLHTICPVKCISIVNRKVTHLGPSSVSISNELPKGNIVQTVKFPCLFPHPKSSSHHSAGTAVCGCVPGLVDILIWVSHFLGEVSNSAPFFSFHLRPAFPPLSDLVCFIKWRLIYVTARSHSSFKDLDFCREAHRL